MPNLPMKQLARDCREQEQDEERLALKLAIQEEKERLGRELDWEDEERVARKLKEAKEMRLASEASRKQRKFWGYPLSKKLRAAMKKKEEMIKHIKDLAENGQIGKFENLLIRLEVSLSTILRPGPGCDTKKRDDNKEQQKLLKTYLEIAITDGVRVKTDSEIDTQATKAAKDEHSLCRMTSLACRVTIEDGHKSFKTNDNREIVNSEYTKIIARVHKKAQIEISKWYIQSVDVFDIFKIPKHIRRLHDNAGALVKDLEGLDEIGRKIEPTDEEVDDGSDHSTSGTVSSTILIADPDPPREHTESEDSGADILETGYDAAADTLFFDDDSADELRSMDTLSYDRMDTMNKYYGSLLRTGRQQSTGQAGDGSSESDQRRLAEQESSSISAGCSILIILPFILFFLLAFKTIYQRMKPNRSSGDTTQEAESASQRGSDEAPEWA